MVNIYEILQRAASLKEETALNSISPERAGGIMYDTLLALNDLWLQQGSALVLSKIYASVAAMEADTAPVSDLTGKPLRPGQIVVIASSDSDNGSVYRYNGTDAPSWSLVGAIGSIPPVDSLDSDSTTLPLAAHQGKVLDGKISQLGQQVIYDISANNSGATFASLSALLSDANLSTLIPVSVRCGGMSIRFVRSSDNKYIQARCMADEFTTDITQWVIAEEGVYVENPEFIYVKTDKEDKILWAIKTDGGIYYGAGVPQQVIDYIEERLGEFSPDEYEDIVEFLNDLEKGDSTLQDLLDKKVDGEYVENPEYIEVKTDNEDKIIEATKNNGTKIFSVGVEIPVIAISDNVTETREDLEERLTVLVDSENKIVSCREKDGTLIENAGIKTESLAFLKEEQYNEFLKNNKKRLDNIIGSDIVLLYPKETMEPILRNLKFANMERNGRFTFNNITYRFQPYTPITFIWFTDIHDNTENLQRIRNFRNAYRDYIDDVVFTGDVMDATYAYYDGNWFHNNNVDNFLFVIGNHDAAESLSPYKPVSPKMCYEKYLAQYLSSTNIICGINKNYWYKDYPTTDIPVADLPEGCPSGIRFIAIDQYHWKEGNKFGVVSYDDGSIVDTGEQKTWLMQVLQEAKENNYAVIVGMHGSAVDTIDVECSFDDFEKFGDHNYADTDNDILDTIQEFIDNGGIFITWLCGHWHQDWFGNIREYPAQTQIVANTASYTMKYRSLIRYKNTKSMDLFNVISIDPYLSHIRLMRIGADFDRHGRHIEKMVYDYKNKKLISNY